MSDYQMDACELKKQHTARLINKAIRGWKAKQLTAEEIAMRIDKMHDQVVSMSKLQFIAVMNNYDKG